MNTIDKYYHIANILNDDIFLSAFVIKRFCPDIAFSKVLKKVESLSLDTLEYAIELAYKLNDEEINKIAKEMSFVNEAQYIHYLQDILNINNIVYAPYCKSEIEIKIEHKKQGALFE